MAHEARVVPTRVIFVNLIVALLLIAGIAGAVLPGLPGAVLVLAAAVIHALATGFDPIGAGRLLVLAGLTGLSYILDYLAAALGARRFGGTRWGVFGAVAGLLLGILVLGPIGLLLGPLIGAITGELLSGRRIEESARGGIGAFLGVVVGLVAKVVLTVLMAGLLVWWIWRS